MRTSACMFHRSAPMMSLWLHPVFRVDTPNRTWTSWRATSSSSTRRTSPRSRWTWSSRTVWWTCRRTRSAWSARYASCFQECSNVGVLNVVKRLLQSVFCNIFSEILTPFIPHMWLRYRTCLCPEASCFQTLITSFWRWIGFAECLSKLEEYILMRSFLILARTVPFCVGQICETPFCPPKYNQFDKVQLLYCTVVVRYISQL